MKYRQSPDTFTEMNNDELMLLEINTNEMYRSNEMGAIIWKLLDGHHSIEEIIEEIMRLCTHVTRDVVKEDVILFIEDLLAKGLIEEVVPEVLEEAKST